MLSITVFTIIIISLYFAVREVASLLKKKVDVTNVKEVTRLIAHRIARPKFSDIHSLPESEREKMVDRLLKRKNLTLSEQNFVNEYLVETGKEKWRYIKGYEGFYRINTYGIVESCRYNRLMDPSVKKEGGYIITLSVGTARKTCSVHKLVAETFIPNPDGACLVIPKDGNYSNCDVRNLMWSKTRKPSTMSLAA